jgi:hypothetical protein
MAVVYPAGPEPMMIILACIEYLAVRNLMSGA